MPNSEDRFINALDQELAPYGARFLSKDRELVDHFSRYNFGWELSLDLTWNEVPVSIWLVFSTPYNNTHPDLYIRNPEIKPLELPHVELNGKLCVWGASVIADFGTPNYVIELLSDCYTMLDSAFKGELTNDFASEFESYWELHCGDNDYVRNPSLIDPTNIKSREIYYCPFLENSFVVGETKESITSWLDSSNKLPKSGKKRERALGRIGTTALLYLSHTLFPQDFPETVEDLLVLVAKEGTEKALVANELIAGALAGCNVLSLPFALLVRAGNEHLLVCFTVYRRQRSKYSVDNIGDGFRSESPVSVALQRSRKLKGGAAAFSRVDSDWIVGRGFNGHRRRISDHTVAIIGCGSIGSSVAPLLIKSGVEQLILVDPDLLEAANTSRHELGIQDISKPKASALKRKLCLDFPQTNIKSFSQSFFDTKEFEEIFEGVDLVISCTADWTSDQALLRLQSKLDIPLIFAFVEAHACVGHVVVNAPGSSAFDSLYFHSGKKIGRLKKPITVWKDDTVIKLPACAGEFQPYGAADISHVHALTVKSAIELLTSDNEKIHSKHAIWVASFKELRAVNGEWNTDWEQEYENLGRGNRVIEHMFVEDRWVQDDEV